VFLGAVVFSVHLFVLCLLGLRAAFAEQLQPKLLFVLLFFLKLLSFACFFLFFALLEVSFVDFASGVLLSFLLLVVGLVFFWRRGSFYLRSLERRS